MPNTDWKRLNHLQLGRYGEYFAMMEFASYGLEVYSSEVDDHGIDFVIKDKHQRFCEIQVKSITEKGYVFVQKDKFDINNNCLFLALLIFDQGHLPNMYLIPAAAWKTPNEAFVDRKYDKPGQKSKPEYGINISNTHFGLIQKYEFKEVIKEFL